MIQPTADRILVRLLHDNRASKTIALTDEKEVMKQSQRALVIAVGPGKLVECVNGGHVRRPVDVRPGDVVYIGPYNEHVFDNDTVLIQEGDIRVKEDVN
jgi:co-chaperonin GroES (HSP10)